MRILTHVMPPNHNLFLFGDDHEGSVLRHNRGWNILIEMMHSSWDGLSPDVNFGVDHGDIIEAIEITDKRYDAHTTEGNVLDQIDQAVKNRESIKEKLITILDGNHPWKLWRYSGTKGLGITQKICSRLDVPYGTFMAKINYVDQSGNLIYKHLAAHGRKPINSTADNIKRRITNMELQLQRHLREKMGDAVLMSRGHTHKILICRPVSALYIWDNTKKTKQGYTESKHTDQFIPPDERWYVSSGSFYRLYGDGYSGYAERADYDPMELGFCIVEVRNRKIKDIKKIVFHGQKYLVM